ncbi:E3 ubiquitin-protein ligase RGLG2 [Phytophthora citrophthora]|uniref:E3 ubiquitin-protein ligase RGLG2 n=1 Tax=Phytophthora citrophthora TaxID=4793 RepID=A0AAD9G3A7_9STRA|nr:E3 ubiquitin-protein ligase RGLG2 [Phytophthora citrophthora]
MGSEAEPVLATVVTVPLPNRSSFRPIPDRYETLGLSFRCLFTTVLPRFLTFSLQNTAEVQQDLRKAGLESSDLVVGVDFTKSNQAKSPCGLEKKRSGSVISIIGRVLEAFDDDNIIPAFGFGDLATKGNSCFPFSQGRGCQGFEEVLRRYNEITPTLKLSGPTNFAPVIKETIRAVRQNGGYHILVIIADGQVTNEEDTRNAIVEASNWPISIIMVGVGDGPWDMMEEFDDKLPARRFDNFQFVEYRAVMQVNKKNPEAGFAIMALMEIPVANANIKSSQTQMTATYLVARVIRVGAIGVEVNDLVVIFALLAQVAATLLVRRARDRLGLQSELVDPELNLVVQVGVVRCAAENRTHVQRIGGHSLLVGNGAMPKPETDPVMATAELTLAAAAAPAARALVDTPNTETTPLAASAEATGAAAPAVPMTVAAAPMTEITMPAILRAASSGPILQVQGSSVLLTMER